MNFHSLFYTDCRADQGLRGGAGFQFQAVSRGTGDDVMNLVQRSALYEAPVAWMREKRPAASYPPSLVHLRDGAYVTARGVYLGTETGGTREGNQFTHAIATRDPQLYDVVRPAQLWEAPWWCEQPALTTECSPIAPEPAPGPYGVDSIQNWLREQSCGQEWLDCLLSAVEQLQEPGGKRILFIGESPEAILKWITAATLLLPQERALGVGFRVFATNPHYCRHDIVAVHPDWSEQFTRSTDFVVFDLVAARHSAVGRCESASYWVPRFFRGDPYDVVDAVELAHQIAVECGRSRPGWADMAVSSILVLGESEPERPGELVDWLASATGESAVEAAQPVIKAVLSTRPSARDLRKLAEAQVPDGVLGEVHLSLLRAELDEVASGVDDERGSIAFVPAWPHEVRERASEMVEAAAARDVPPERMDGLLGVATRFGITPRLHRFHGAMQRFVRWWVGHPWADVDLSLWSCGSEVLGLLRNELADQLAADADGRVVRDIKQRWWELLLSTATNPFVPVEALVVSAAAEAGERSRREAITVALNRPYGRRGNGRAEAVWDAVFRYVDPTMSDVALFLGELPRAEVTSSLADRALAVLSSSAVSGELLDVLPLLAGHMRSPHHDALLDLSQQDGALRRWIEEFVRRSRAAPGLSFPAVPSKVLRAREREIVEVLVGHDLAAASAAVASGGEQLQAVIARALPCRWNSVEMGVADRDRRVALAVLARVSDGLCKEAQDRLSARIDQWVRDHDGEDHRRLSRLLRSTSPNAAAYLHDRVGSAGSAKTGAKRRQRRLFGRNREYE